MHACTHNQPPHTSEGCEQLRAWSRPSKHASISFAICVWARAATHTRVVAHHHGLCVPKSAAAAVVAILVAAESKVPLLSALVVAFNDREHLIEAQVVRSALLQHLVRRELWVVCRARLLRRHCRLCCWRCRWLLFLLLLVWLFAEQTTKEPPSCRNSGVSQLPQQGMEDSTNA